MPEATRRATTTAEELTIRRVEHERDFTIIVNSTLREKRLSFRARGLLGFLLSLPNDWRIASDRLAAEGTEGRDAVRKAMTELEGLGYIERHRETGGGGRIRTVVTVHERPVAGFSGVGQSVAGPTCEDSANGQVTPTTDSQASVDQASIEVPRRRDREEELLALLGDGQPAADPKVRKPRARNVIFDALAAVYPAKTPSENARVGKAAAELKKLDPVPTPEVVRARASWARREWPKSTVLAVVNNWSNIGERMAHIPPPTYGAPVRPARARQNGSGERFDQTEWASSL